MFREMLSAHGYKNFQQIKIAKNSKDLFTGVQKFGQNGYIIISLQPLQDKSPSRSIIKFKKYKEGQWVDQLLANFLLSDSRLQPA